MAESIAGFMVIGFIFALGSWLVTLILLARISHWAHATQKRLDVANSLLSQLGHLLDQRLPPR